FRAASIKTAEAAKVIENAQRDINIAFINEVTQIFNRLGLSIYDVLSASATKWNFLNFRPGLVGGHCIGVDPYYLAACASAL
ncbi:Vi polysaccharide biosynthesis UDP-N-acetylglucosamine C-6 dehydrogenase TviB, partial [Acinetobacter baumannii]